MAPKITGKYTSIEDAVRAGDLKAVKYFVEEQGADIDAQTGGEFSRPLIFIALDNERRNIIKYFLSKGVDLFQKPTGERMGEDKEYNAIIQAIEKGNYWAAKKMIAAVPTEKISALGLSSPFPNRNFLSYVLRKAGNEITLFRAILDKGIDVNECNHGSPPLHVALRNGKLKATKLLLEHGADPEHVDPTTKGTSLMAAVDTLEDTRCLKYLMKYITIEKYPNDKKLQALRFALEKNCEEAAILLSKKTDLTELDNDTLKKLNVFKLFDAVRKGNLNAVKHMIEKEHMDVDTRSYDHITNTPIFPAINCNHPHIVQYLINQGADLGAVGYSARETTPLIRAIDTQNMKVIKMIIDGIKQDDIRALENPINKQHPPLQLAIIHGWNNLVESLLEKGASKQKDSHRSLFYLLQLAARENNVKAVDLLIKHGANPSFQKKDGPSYSYPFVEYLADIGNVNMLKQIMEKNFVELDCANAEGKTPLWCAVKKKHHSMVRFLLSQGANVEGLPDIDNNSTFKEALQQSAQHAGHRATFFAKKSAASGIAAVSSAVAAKYALVALGVLSFAHPAALFVMAVVITLTVLTAYWAKKGVGEYRGKLAIDNALSDAGPDTGAGDKASAHNDTDDAAEPEAEAEVDADANTDIETEDHPVSPRSSRS